MTSQTLADSGREAVAAKGEPARALAGWPRGVLELIDDPVRVTGWHPWFSECPNDIQYFELDVRRPEDVNRLIKKLAAVKAKQRRLRLDRAAGAPHANGVGAIFTLGNQPIIDRWFKRLPEVQPGVRKFGVHQYREPPTAQPPTLIIYLGHPAVDLKQLKIPANIRVIPPDVKSTGESRAELSRQINKSIAGRGVEQ